MSYFQKILKINPFTRDKIPSNLTNNSSVSFQTKLVVFPYLRNNCHSETGLKEIVYITYLPRGICIKAALYIVFLHDVALSICKASVYSLKT